MPALERKFIDDLGSTVVKELTRLMNSASVRTTPTLITIADTGEAFFQLLQTDEDILIQELFVGNATHVYDIVGVLTAITLAMDEDPEFDTPVILFSRTNFGGGNSIAGNTLVPMSTQGAVVEVGTFPLLLLAGNALGLHVKNEEGGGQAIDLVVSVKYRPVSDTLVLTPDAPQPVKAFSERNIA